MNTYVYSMSAPQIAEHLNVTPRTIRHWVESGDLPKLDRGQFDLGWASWLQTGRKLSADWRGKVSAKTAVAAGWVHLLDHEPRDADLEALSDLFIRNDFTLADAMQALGAAQARLGRS